MKSKILLFAILGLSLKAYSQNSKPKIAVANPLVSGLSSSSITVGKLFRLEAMKLDQYNFMDELEMNDLISSNNEYVNNCHGIDCISRLGNDLGVDYVVSGMVDAFPNKIVVTVKIINVKTKSAYKTKIEEFENIEMELQRMIEIVFRDMFEIPVRKEVREKFKYKDEIITNDVWRVNNAGPRIGYSILAGTYKEFANRPLKNGGLEIYPGLSSVGYQFENQYFGAEKFSGMLEAVFCFSGMEQGILLPSFNVLNGFRFGKYGWEIAFGPGLTFKKTSFGFFDVDNTFDKGFNTYFSEDDWQNFAYIQYLNGNPDYSTQSTTNYTSVEPTKFNPNYNFNSRFFDKRGDVGITALWTISLTKTFRSGSLNIPVSAVYTSIGRASMYSLFVGLNVPKKKTKIKIK